MEQKQIVNSGDFDFLGRVMFLQKAMIKSSVAPVVVVKASEGGLGRDYGSAMYYDCVEPEEKGLEVMKKRIKIAKGDIEQHFRLHESVLEAFLEMDNAILSNNRAGFAVSCVDACNSARAYLDLVKEHTSVLGEEAFLVYPYQERELFHIWQGGLVKEFFFNLGRSYENAGSDLDEIEGLMLNFRIRQGKLPYISMPLASDAGAGLYDNTLAQNLNTTRQLLKRAGLRV